MPAPSLFERHRPPRGVLVPGEDGQVLHLSVAQRLDDGLRPLQVGDERDARVHRSAADVVSIGAAELVVLDGDVDHQVDEATDPLLRSGLRERLQKKRLECSLFDTDRFCRNIEAAYTTMWELWQRGERPRSFSVRV